MIPGIIMLIVLILMVVFISKRIKKAQHIFDDIEVRRPDEQKEEVEKDGKE